MSWVKFGDDWGIVKWLGVCGGWEQVLRCVFTFVHDAFAWGHGGCVDDGGSTLGVFSRILGDALSHLMQKCLCRVVHEVRTSGAEFLNTSYQSSVCEYVGR